MKRPYFFIITLGLFFSVILGGCYSTKQITIQVLHPPEKIIFNTPRNLVLINRLLADTCLYDTLHFNELKIPVKMYQELTWKTFYGFADVATESPWVQNILFDSVFVDSVSPRYIPPALNPVKTDDLLTKNQATVGIDLAKVSFGDSIYSSHEFLLNDEEDGGGAWYFIVNVNLYIQTYWFLYLEKEPEPVDSVKLVDVMTVNGTGLNYQEAVSNLPNIKKVIQDLSYQGGQHYAYRIFPVWDNVTRIYYNDNINKKMKKAAMLAQQSQWMEAATIWRSLAFSKNKSTASRAAFNMALASEINNKLDLAESWLKKSIQLQSSPIAKNYLDIVRERQKDYRKMNINTSK